MKLKIITHERVIFDDTVDEIYSRGVDGEFGVLKGHMPFMSALDVGVTKVLQGSKVKFFTTMGGVFQLKDNEAIILTQTGEAGAEIDIARAKEAHARANTRRAEAAAEIDAKSAEAARARALARIKASMEK